MKTLKDKIIREEVEEGYETIYVEDLKQAIKDLKDAQWNAKGQFCKKQMLDLIDKIMRVWEK